MSKLTGIILMLATFIALQSCSNPLSEIKSNVSIKLKEGAAEAIKSMVEITEKLEKAKIKIEENESYQSVLIESGGEYSSDNGKISTLYLTLHYDKSESGNKEELRTLGRELLEDIMRVAAFESGYDKYEVKFLKNATVDPTVTSNFKRFIYNHSELDGINL